MPIPVLIIDDEKDVVKAMRDTLVKENFEVSAAYTGESGIKTATSQVPQLIILDLRLPDKTGFEVCQELKKNAATEHIPIIMVTTRSSDTEKIVGLEVGADDYITKPFNPLELLARIKAVLRRSQKKPAKISPEISHGPIRLSQDARSVLVNNKPVTLTRKEFDLLVHMLINVGKALSRKNILESVWGEAYDSLQGTVDTHIKSLRKKLGSAGTLIETLPGVGYRFADQDA